MTMTTKKRQKTVYGTHYVLMKGRKSFKFLNLQVVLHCSSKGIERANTVLSPALQLAADDLSVVPGKGQTKNRLSSLLWPTGEQL